MKPSPPHLSPSPSPGRSPDLSPGGVSGRDPLPPLPPVAGLGAEVRESLLLLSFAVAVTVGLTTVAQAALTVLS